MSAVNHSGNLWSHSFWKQPSLDFRVSCCMQLQSSKKKIVCQTNGRIASREALLRCIPISRRLLTAQSAYLQFNDCVNNVSIEPRIDSTEAAVELSCFFFRFKCKNVATPIWYHDTLALFGAVSLGEFSLHLESKPPRRVLIHICSRSDHLNNRIKYDSCISVTQNISGINRCTRSMKWLRRPLY